MKKGIEPIRYSPQGLVLHPPTDGNLYVDRSHPSANAQGIPIKPYERIAEIPSPLFYQRRLDSIDAKVDTVGRPYFSTTFLNQYTEGPRYGSNRDNQKSLYH
jgi:hypothetical protein